MLFLRCRLVRYWTLFAGGFWLQRWAHLESNYRFDFQFMSVRDKFRLQARRFSSCHPAFWIAECTSAAATYDNQIIRRNEYQKHVRSIWDLPLYVMLSINSCHCSYGQLHPCSTPIPETLQVRTCRAWSKCTRSWLFLKMIKRLLRS